MLLLHMMEQVAWWTQLMSYQSPSSYQHYPAAVIELPWKCITLHQKCSIQEGSRLTGDERVLVLLVSSATGASDPAFTM